MYKVTVVQEGTARKRILKKVQPYQTLLEICLDNKIELAHACGGVCHCTTCAVQVVKGNNYLDEASRRELDFLNKRGNGLINARLACQTMLLKGEGKIEFIIPKPEEE